MKRYCPSRCVFQNHLSFSLAQFITKLQFHTICIMNGKGCDVDSDAKREEFVKGLIIIFVCFL